MDNRNLVSSVHYAGVGGFDYVRILSGIAKVRTKPKNNAHEPVTDGYTHP